MTEPGMATILGECLDELLWRSALGVALRQRAKFEGWLKIELAHALEQRGARVLLEAEVPGTSGPKYRADIQADFPAAGPTFIMLKTNNSNFRFVGIQPRGRSVTRNIAKTGEDVEKLRPAASSSLTFVVFPFFPVTVSDGERAEQVQPHLTRLLQGSPACLVREGFVIPPSFSGAWGIAWYIVARDGTSPER